jgi:exonuclease SbcD
MKFLHAADLHLDSPLLGLDRYAGAPVAALRGATRRALENLVALARTEEVDAVVIAGDLFDGDWKDFNTGLFLVGQMAKLREAEIPVWLVSGNHDAASRISRALSLPENVHRLSDRKIETSMDEKLGLAVHGRGFNAPQLTENVVPDFPPARSGLFNIGLLHTSAEGRPGHATYAPCSVEDMLARGYDYWALGHVHTREILAQTPAYVVFPGNPQGRHIREPGPRGCYITEVDGNLRAAEPVFHPLDVVRWERVAVDASPHATPDAVIMAIRASLASALEGTEGRLLAARVDITGASEAHEALALDPAKWREEILGLAVDLGGEGLWIEKTNFKTTLPQSAHAGVAVGPLSELLARVDASDHDGIAEMLRPFCDWLPADLFDEDTPRFDAETGRLELLNAAREEVRRALLTPPA